MLLILLRSIVRVYRRHSSVCLHALLLLRLPPNFSPSTSRSLPLPSLTFLAPHRSSAETLTYWHRPHTSKTRLAILFIHEIGIGLYQYINLLAEINSGDGTDGSDGELGIIAVEIMSVNSRITSEALDKESMCQEIDCILRAHSWDKFVLVSYS
jgi:hypothetical protein